MLGRKINHISINKCIPAFYDTSFFICIKQYLLDFMLLLIPVLIFKMLIGRILPKISFSVITLLFAGEIHCLHWHTQIVMEIV